MLCWCNKPSRPADAFFHMHLHVMHSDLITGGLHVPPTTYLQKSSISWVGSSLRKDSCGRTLYKAVKVAGQELRLGQVGPGVLLPEVCTEILLSQGHLP
jgi:hypothetical protein